MADHDWDSFLALNCRLPVEQINFKESAGGPLVLALRSLCFFFSFIASLFS